MNKKQMKEYRVWKAMKARCYAPSYKDRGSYQKKGIKVCDRWKNSFENFLEDMGNIPFDDASIERIDNNGDYCPENCKWIHIGDQSKNRDNLRMYVIDGERMYLKEISRKYGINYSTLVKRMDCGMSLEEAISKPLEKGREKERKAVIQEEMDGTFVACYESIASASKTTGISAASISHCCHKQRNKAGNYAWKFA